MVSRIVAGTFSPSVLLDVARTTGRLAGAGLEVTEVSVASSPGQFRSLADGEIDVAFTSPDNVLAYRSDPANPLGVLLDVELVSGIDRGLGLALYGRPGFTAAELAGARLGVDVPVSGFALAMYALTEFLGVSRGGYELLTLGSTPRRLAALRAGDCDATMLNAGNDLLAEESGCVRLASVAEVCGPYLGTVTAVIGQAHLAEARALGEALAATIDDIRSGAVTDVAVDAAAARLGAGPEVARRYVDRMQSPAEGLLPGAQVDPAARETVAALRRRFLR